MRGIIPFALCPFDLCTDATALLWVQTQVARKGIVGFEGQAIHLTDRPQEVRRAFCSPAKARTLLGYHTMRWLEDGLGDIVEYIKRIGPRKFRYHIGIEMHNDLTPRTWTERLM